MANIKKGKITPKKENPSCRCKNGTVFTPFIVVKGKRIDHPKGGVFKFPCSRCGQ